MKKILLMLIVLTSVQHVYSQTHFLIKGGANYTNNVATESGVQEGSYKFGFHAGVGADINLTENLHLYPELFYSNKGYKFEGSGNSNEDGNLHLNYINLPVLIGLRIFEQFSLVAGPEFGYLVSAKSKSDSESVDVKDIWDNNFDVGISIGTIYHTTGKLQFDIRYVHGLSSAIKDVILTSNGTSNEGSIKFQNRTFQIGVGYQLN